MTLYSLVVYRTTVAARAPPKIICLFPKFQRRIFDSYLAVEDPFITIDRVFSSLCAIYSFVYHQKPRMIVERSRIATLLAWCDNILWAHTYSIGKERAERKLFTKISVGVQSWGGERRSIYLRSKDARYEWSHFTIWVFFSFFRLSTNHRRLQKNNWE